MKRFFCILLALFMVLPCAFAQDMRTAPYETIILGPSTETDPPQLTGIAGLKGGDAYEVLAVIDQSNAAEQPPYVQAWLDTYILHHIRRTNPQTNQTTEGYLVAGYVPQDVNAIPEITQEFGQLVTIEGRSCEKLTLQMVDKWDQGYTLVKPPEGSLTLEQALRRALDALMDKYGETEATLKRLYVSAGHRPADDYSPMYWQFDFRSDLYKLDGYAVTIASEDGALLHISGPGEGVG